jgi:hypothetical protein
VIRDWQVRQALRSYRALAAHIDELTEEEVLHCLELEAASSRRTAIINRLIARALRLRELALRAQLKERFQWHAPSPSPK